MEELEMMEMEEVKKAWTARYLLEPPAPEVLGRALATIEALNGALVTVNLARKLGGEYDMARIGGGSGYDMKILFESVMAANAAANETLTVLKKKGYVE